MKDLKSQILSEVEEHLGPGYVMTVAEAMEKCETLAKMVGLRETSRKESEPQKQNTFDLRACVDDLKGIWPDQLRRSGVMFYNGSRITIDDFEKEAKRQRYVFRIA